jgi:hypothetical protein
MPLTPFLGFSVIIHLGFIIGHKLFSFADKGEPVKKNLKAGSGRLNFTVVLGIFMVVTSSALFLVRESLVEKHSSFYMAERAFVSFYAATKAKALPANNSAAVLPSPDFKASAQQLVFGRILKTATPEECARPLSGNFVSDDYFINSSYSGFWGSPLTPAEGLDSINSQIAGSFNIYPRGTLLSEEQELSLGLCGQIAGNYFIN